MLIFTLAATLSITPAFSVPEQANSKAKEMAVVSIPANAKEIGPGVFDIGYRVYDGKVVQGTLYVFSEKEFAKPDGKPGNGNNKDKGESTGDETSTCYSYITKGAKWRAEEPWTISLAGAPTGIDVTGILVNAVNQWETANGHANEIMEDLNSSLTVIPGSIGKTMDGANEVAFGDITDDGVIAATWVWRTVSGPPSQRYIAEWDQVYDVDTFDWINGDPNSMDFDNIATHEVGHAVGMGHPDSTCTLETMYAYASNGETIKRDLHTGDKTGVNRLY